jgi:hypothetical protein
MARLRASRTSDPSMEVPSLRPTTRRLNRTKHIARSCQPEVVLMSVMSPAQQRFGFGGVKSCSKWFLATPSAPRALLQGRKARLPALPFVAAAVDHSQPAAEPGDGFLINELIDLGETFWRQLLLGKVRFRQPEKILFPPQLAVFAAELHQFSSFRAGQRALATITELTTIDTGQIVHLARLLTGMPRRWATAVQVRPSARQIATASSF